ncbi:MAG: PKD domain-containing protein, partial [Mariniphaga sp.]
MPNNIYGNYYLYIPPTYSSTTPYIPVGYNYPTTSGNPHQVCATAYFNLIQYPNAHQSYTTCFTIYVDTIPSFTLSLSDDTICPECDGNMDNLVCVHIGTSNSYSPQEIININWGTNDCIQVNDSCAVYFYTGTYPIIVTDSNACGSSKDTAWIVVSLKPRIICADTICLGNVQLTGGSYCSDANITNYAWDFGDGQSLSVSYNPVNHPYTQVGNYTIQLIITDFCGNKDTVTKTITVAPPPALPIIIGNHNNCDDPATYSISNGNPNYTYAWTISLPNYGNIPVQNGSTATVHWFPYYANQNTPTFTWLIVEVTDNFGCTSKDSIKIWKCCIKANSINSQVNDTTITSLASYNGKIINGTLTINGTIFLSSPTINILMGPEAKIIVTPPHTFTVYNTTITNYCNYMWDGIYITDSSAVFVDSIGITENALNAVVSEKGGKFRLNGTKFYNNYISVLAKDYYHIPVFNSNGHPHKGTIKGCEFNKVGNGLIPPYLGQKPRFGIYFDNVDRLTIGDSVIASNTNLFYNLFCGIYSKNSKTTVVNNIFKNIKPLSYAMTNPNDYINILNETAIFSIFDNPHGLSNINGSSLICGGGSSNTRNYFYSCLNGIYTYRTNTKITNSKLHSTTNGIKCRDYQTGSYITRNYLATNIGYGIQVLNTSPLYRKITVKYDTIIYPSYGIIVTNVKSIATLSNLNSTVSNNYITNNKIGVVSGIQINNCDQIGVFCNTVTRLVAPSSPTLASLIKGMQINQSLNAMIHDNTTERNGRGIKGAGSLLGTQFKCNTSQGNNNGFYFDASLNSV